MTLNFQSHGPVIQAAYNRVANSKTGDEWAIFDYEGNTNVIKVGDEGDGGLEEFSNSFNSGRLQYGLISVKLCEKALSKIVLVHWQGEGVPSARVACATSHVNDVRKHLKTVHTVVYARSEMDVESDSIKREVSKLPASYAESKVETSYSTPTSVSSVYKPVKPHVDINVKEREQFWDKMNVEEKRRQQEQQKKHLDDEKKWTEERKQLSDEISHKSDIAITSAPVKNQIIPPSVPITSSPVPSNVPSKNLISGRVGMFQTKEDVSVPMPKPNVTVASTPKIEQLSLYDQVPSQEQISVEPEITPTAPIPSAPFPNPVPTVSVGNNISQYDVPPSTGLCAIALWDYQAEDATEITFDPNDIISEIEQIDEGWWKGKAPNGSFGLFPANYVKIL
ncbi:unnamed protein product [Auanema sp. JU1783]|nr:unnamed protein product [Auanema sp. JU1783]